MRSAARRCLRVVGLKTEDGCRSVSWKKWSKACRIRPKGEESVRRIAVVRRLPVMARCPLHRRFFPLLKNNHDEITAEHKRACPSEQ